MVIDDPRAGCVPSHQAQLDGKKKKKKKRSASHDGKTLKLISGCVRRALVLILPVLACSPRSL